MCQFSLHVWQQYLPFWLGSLASLGLNKAFLLLRVLFLLSSGHSTNAISSLSLPAHIITYCFTMASQGTAYSVTTNYTSTTPFDFYLSLYCILGYVISLYYISSCIHSCGHILEATGHFSPPRISNKGFLRRLRRSRGRRTKKNHSWHRPPRYNHIDSRTSAHANHLSTQSTTTTYDGFDSLPDPTTPYHRVLHLCHFGSHFTKLVNRSPDILSILGPPSFSFLHPTSPPSSPYSVTELAFTSNNQTLDLTDITRMPQPASFVRFQTVYSINNGDYPLIFDTGASTTITPFKEDFITFQQDNGNSRLQGITGSTVCQGKGVIELSIIADDGTCKIINTNALYVPEAKVRLLSVQSYCAEKHHGSQMVIDGKSCYFNFPSSIGGGRITFDLPSGGNLPRTSASRQLRKSTQPTSVGAFTVIHDDNKNLTRAQKHLLQWHWRLGHASMAWIQYLFRQNVIPTNNTSGVTTTSCKCHACQLGKQVRQSEGVNKSTIRSNKDGNLKKESLSVGSVISSDQFVSSLKGRLPHTYGKENENDKFVGGTIFVDEASEFITVQNQVSLGAVETVHAKNRMEREALRHGIKIKSYRCDNGVYRAKHFVDDTIRHHQTIKYSGIGAHHHNGIAERAIRTISTSARTILLHAMIHWPDETTLDLWPFAIDYAVYLWNRLPRSPSGLSPEELYYRTTSSHEDLRNAKVWGCPTYVLDPTLQDGKKLPRWEPRSKLGQFLGRSKVHAGSVGLIKNTATGNISSQFHVVFDEHFTTLPVNNIPTSDSIPDEWKDLFIYDRENLYDPDDLPITNPQTPLRTPVGFNPTRSESIPTEGDSVTEGDQVPPPPTTSESEGGRSVSFRLPPVTTPVLPPPPSSAPLPTSSSPLSPPPHLDPPPLRRSSRTSKPPDRYVPTGKLAHPYSSFFNNEYLGYLMDFNQMNSHDAFLISSDLNSRPNALTISYDTIHHMKLDDDDPSIIHGQHPLAFSARANSEDTPTLQEAMSSPDRDGFLEAMHAELDSLEGMEAWNVVPRSKPITEDRRILPSTWVLRRKRFPDGSVKKLKARLCVRGDRQIEGVDYFDTFSPVVHWSTVRLMLILSILLGLKTVQVDYTLAFVQAPAEPGTYIEMPKMFELDGMVLELRRNLYGLCDAPKNFYNYLREGLEARGLTPSKHDHCLFMSKDIIVLTYVDDCIFFARDDKTIDSFIESLKKAPDKLKHKFHEFQLSKEEDYAGFLGISIDKSTDGLIELTQTGLIDRILSALNLNQDNASVRTEPASPNPLGKEEDSPPRKESWSYPSIIGMMLYLSSNSRPDIAFAVNQAARFTHCARLSHETALKRIGRYLKSTRDKGLIMKPSSSLSLDFFADADFAGLWNVEHPDDPISVKSRTGFVVTLGDTPITWSSKLQTEIATSTMHAEYIALSTGMRELIPIKNTLDDICDTFKIHRDKHTQIVKVFEDNEGALRLAQSPLTKVTPQSKHFAVKYHWFREKIDEFKLSFRHISTNLQKADLFTKGLSKSEFQSKRKLLLGW
jgi:hypothetical protein